MISNRARDWRRPPLAIYGIALAAIMMATGDASVPMWWATTLGFWLLAMVPLAMLALGRKNAVAKLVGMLAIGGIGIWAYVYAMFLGPPDPQNPIVFAVMPFYQLAAALVWLVMIWIYRKFRKGDGG